MDSIVVAEESCKKAAAQFGDLYRGAHALPNYPAGCSNRASQNNVIFNTITDPSLISITPAFHPPAGPLPRSVVRAICLSKGTLFYGYFKYCILVLRI